MSQNLTEHPVTKDFLRLTRYTCPHGYEEELYDDLLVKTYGARKDIKGNYFVVIPGSKALFACHMDTAGGKGMPVKVKRQWQKGGFLTTDGTTLLGADDKAGMAVLLHMIRNEVPGIYAFYVGEETGCVGSRHHALNYDLYLPQLGVDAIEQVVSFDRYGYESVITHQYGRCASDDYAWAVAEQYSRHGVGSLAPDEHGLFTDSAQFTHVVGECTNISVGYGGHHTVKEHQDIPFLIAVAEASCKVEWNDLPLKRRPGEHDRYDHYDSGYGGSYDWERTPTGWRLKTRVKQLPKPEVEEDEDIKAWKRESVGLRRIPEAEEILDTERYWTYDELLEFVEASPYDAAYVIETLLDLRWQIEQDERDRGDAEFDELPPFATTREEELDAYFGAVDV